MWDDGAIWRGAQEDRLLLRACRGCGGLCHPPLPVCPACGGRQWDERPASGLASLYSWGLVESTQGDGPARMIVVADLAEGLRFVANLVDVPSSAIWPKGCGLRGPYFQDQTRNNGVPVVNFAIADFGNGADAVEIVEFALGHKLNG